MSDFFWATYLILWILVAVQTLMLVLLYRQFGLMWMRGQRRLALQGLDIGVKPPVIQLESFQHDARDLQLTWDPQGEALRAWLLLFALPSCPICKSLFERVGDLPGHWSGVEFVWVDTQASPNANGNGQAVQPYGWVYGMSPDEAAHQAMDVPGVPYGYVVSAEGRIAAKGVVNSIDDIESLMKEAGLVPQPAPSAT